MGSCLTGTDLAERAKACSSRGGCEEVHATKKDPSRIYLNREGSEQHMDVYNLSYTTKSNMRRYGKTMADPMAKVHLVGPSYCVSRKEVHQASPIARSRSRYQQSQHEIPRSPSSVDPLTSQLRRERGIIGFVIWAYQSRRD
jgi:hypothetical protein